MKSQYDKKPIPVGEQINLLESKGMEFYDRAFASHVLSIIGYYRFSGYFLSYIPNSIDSQLSVITVLADMPIHSEMKLITADLSRKPLSRRFIQYMSSTDH